jgi:glycine/D-amino acid oxidase-like deaminating enzyme
LGPITGKLIADTLSGRPIAAAKAAVLSPDRY